MLLLPGSSPSSVDVVAVSLLIKPIATAGLITTAEPLLLPSPLCTLSRSDWTAALHELHTHVTFQQQAVARSSSKHSKSNEQQVSFTQQLIASSSSSSSAVQTYRPSACSGAALYYKVISCSNEAICKPLAQACVGSSSIKLDFTLLLGVVLTVGVTGIETPYRLVQRMEDAITVVGRMKQDEKEEHAVTEFLQGFLLHDAAPTNNETYAYRNTLLLPVEDTETNKKTLTPLTLVPHIPDPAAVTDVLAILSVDERETYLQPYTQTGAERYGQMLDDLLSGKSTTSKGKNSRFLRRKKAPVEADLDANFDFKDGSSSIGGGTLFQPPSNKDTAPNTTPSLSNMLRKPLGLGDRRKSSETLDSASSSAPSLKLSKKDTKLKHLPAPRSGTRRPRSGAASVASTSGATSVAAASVATDPPEDGTTEDQRRLQVNIALNEDLTCLYKDSQLHTCTVDGVVQIQVKAATSSIPPFLLLVRDTTNQLQNLEENQTFVEQQKAAGGPETTFLVKAPKADTYHPTFKYKCSNELRPVPIVSMKDCCRCVRCVYVPFHSQTIYLSTNSAFKPASKRMLTPVESPCKSAPIPTIPPV